MAILLKSTGSFILPPANASPEALRDFLDRQVARYNQPGFIENDPVCIPHLFGRRQDIEIMGFWAAVLAWGQRKTIIAKCRELAGLMDGAPYDFITQHRPSDLKRFLHFKHRTFNATDTLYFIEFFRQHYARSRSLEQAFLEPLFAGSTVETGFVAGSSSFASPIVSAPIASGSAAAVPAGGRKVVVTAKLKAAASTTAASEEEPVERYLNNFRRNFFSLPEFPSRTMKHIPAPERNSACKRMNMFLRWMVRKDENGVDFGIWEKIRPAQLVCPCDVHVERVARKLGLITRPQAGWATAVELTRNLRELDAADPVKYDFALFGMGVSGEI